MRRARLAGWGAALALTAVTACDPGDDVEPTQAAAALETQRTEVRELVAVLARGAVSPLDGRIRTASGHWEGCDSVFPEGHRNFRYRASARIDAGPGAAVGSSLDSLGPVLQEAGLAEATPGERPGGHTLTATRGELEVRFSELPGQGRYVLLDVTGPCIDVPEDERDYWEGRPDPTPIV